MLTEDKNRLLTEVGPTKPMGRLLRRYWMPIAGVSELDERATKPVRIMGEDLVLYKDLSGTFGLIDRRCAHRRADLSYGMVESVGLRCNYHGWRFDQTGQCVQQPFEDTCFAVNRGREGTRLVAYPVKTLGGLVWTYMGPLPAPELPDWEAFSWDNGYAQIVVSEVPCNWFQAQENSIDPVHFEWMHENWGKRLRTNDTALGPTHLKLDFPEFEFGFTYRRIKEDTDEHDEAWTVGRVCLWPNAFFLGEHFEWRVPIDDENLLSITWKYTRVPVEREPYRQASIPTWHGPLTDAAGRWIDTHIMNQDFLAWVGQGRIADRTKERLATSDRGIVAIRRRFFSELEAQERGEEPKGLIRDPARNRRVPLPMMDRDVTLRAYSVAEILANPRLKTMYTSYIFQAGQPERVRREFSEAMGLEVEEYRGIVAPRSGRGDIPIAEVQITAST